MTYDENGIAIKTYTCARCGKSFDAAYATKFCSDFCRRVSRSERQAVARGKRRGKADA